MQSEGRGCVVGREGPVAVEWQATAKVMPVPSCRRTTTVAEHREEADVEGGGSTVVRGWAVEVGVASHDQGAPEDDDGMALRTEPLMVVPNPVEFSVT